MRGWDGNVGRLGYYGLGSYRVKELELTGRYDVWDRDLDRESSAADVLERDFTVGLNYYLTGNGVRAQANVTRRTFGGVLPAATVIQTGLQTAW